MYDGHALSTSCGPSPGLHPGPGADGQALLSRASHARGEKGAAREVPEQRRLLVTAPRPAGPAVTSSACPGRGGPPACAGPPDGAPETEVRAETPQHEEQPAAVQTSCRYCSCRAVPFKSQMLPSGCLCLHARPPWQLAGRRQGGGGGGPRWPPGGQSRWRVSPTPASFSGSSGVRRASSSLCAPGLQGRHEKTPVGGMGPGQELAAQRRAASGPGPRARWRLWLS